MGRRPKSTVIAEASPVKEDIAPPPVEEQAVSIFEELPEPVRDTPKLDEDLTPEQKNHFLKLLRKEITIEDRAKQLAKLAKLTGTKTAAVGLRAIQTINELEGWSDPQAGEAPPMFALPEGSRVAVAVKVPDK